MNKSKLLAMVLSVTLFTVLLSGCWIKLPWMEEENGVVDTPQDDLQTGLMPPAQDPVDIPTIQNMRPTVLYLMDKDMRGLIHFATQIPWVEGIARSTVNHLIAGTANDVMVAGTDMKLPLPAGTKILGATIQDDGVCRIDFSKELLNSTNAQHEKIIVDAIVFTLTEFSNITKVQIMVDGHILDQLPNGTKVGSPIGRPSTSALPGMLVNNHA